MIIDDKNLFKPVTTCATLSQQVSNLSDRMQWSQASMLRIIKKKKSPPFPYTAKLAASLGDLSREDWLGL